MFSTTMILEGHQDEVWSIKWSHDGARLASASKDKSVIIWELQPDNDSMSQVLTLRDHPFATSCLAWSQDDSILLTSSEHYIKVWNAKTGVCIRDIEVHSQTITALVTLLDGSGFLSAGVDKKIVRYDSHGNQTEIWKLSPSLVFDLALSPDNARLVTVGRTFTDAGAMMHVYDFASKEIQKTIALESDEVTSVDISRDSQFVLLNIASDNIHLWDIGKGKLVRKYTGHQQGNHVIRSRFEGIDEELVVSGSQDSNVHIWDRETGASLAVLSGHGQGSVNSVAWNPRNIKLFASCSDDHTVRIWMAERSSH
ncbi:WD40-repeat-containing domain protein [Mycena floridula]|nr:WD40-repeat-containing domain protein [Mycena floridula]